MKIPRKAKRQIKKSMASQGISTNKKRKQNAPIKSQVSKGQIPRKKVVYSFNEGDLVTTNPKDYEFKDTSSICLVLDYDEGDYLTVWRPTGAFSARASSVRIIQRA
jgi:hypothetical protein